MFKGEQRRAFDQLDALIQTRQMDVLARHLSMYRIGLKGDQLPVRRQGARHPDAAVGPQGANFQNAPGLSHTHKQRQQLALIGGDIVGR